MADSLITIAFQTDKPLAAYGPLAATVEGYGFDGVTVYNDLMYQPAWLPLLEIARHTSRVRLGPAAVNPFTAHPINIAGNIALLDEAAQGRTYLGLARGSWLDSIGVEPKRPLTAMSEALGCIRHLLSGSTDPYPAQIFPLSAGTVLRWQGFRADIPFLLGAWGPKTIQACIQQVTEIKIGGTTNPEVIPPIQRSIETSLAQTNIQTTEVTIVTGAVTVVDQDGQAARALARREAALYLPIIATLDQSLNIDPEQLNQINEAVAASDFERAGSYISDDLLDRLAFSGTPDEVAEQAFALFEAGVGRIEFGTPHGLNPSEGLRLLGNYVLPALR